MRYNVFAGEQLVALLSFGASAWKFKARERFVGWSEAQRQQNLQLVVNNARFLILPWIESKGLASKILSRAARQLPEDWLRRYGFRPVLLDVGDGANMRDSCRFENAALLGCHLSRRVGRSR